MTQPRTRTTTRTRWRVLLLPVAALTVAGASTAPAWAANDGQFANLTGRAEVPGPGDANGSGAAILDLHPGSGRVCATVSVSQLGVVIAGHVHKGRAGVAGPVVIDLTSAVTGGARCATGVPRSLILAMQSNPAGYYVNVHTKEFPDGAVRGQLHT